MAFSSRVLVEMRLGDCLGC